MSPEPQGLESDIVSLLLCFCLYMHSRLLSFAATFAALAFLGTSLHSLPWNGFVSRFGLLDFFEALEVLAHRLVRRLVVRFF